MLQLGGGQSIKSPRTIAIEASNIRLSTRSKYLGMALNKSNYSKWKLKQVFEKQKAVDVDVRLNYVDDSTSVRVRNAETARGTTFQHIPHTINIELP